MEPGKEVMMPEEQMYRIRFSHDYVKLHGQRKAVLLAVVRITIDRSGRWDKLLDYDTLTVDGSRYPIKPGRYVQLVFCGDDGIPFTTIRPDTPAKGEMAAKFDYYNNLVGQHFRIEIKEAGDADSPGNGRMV